MSNIVLRLKREFLGAIPVILFFFIVFQLLALTKALLLKGYGIQVSTFLNATIAAVVVGKVVPITDLLPIMNRFPNKPLIYNIMWKTCIYMVAAILVRYVEHIIPFIREHKNLAAANSHLFSEVVWPHFWIVHLWLLVCFFMYCTIRELGRILGYDQIRSMFFGTGKSNVA